MALIQLVCHWLCQCKRSERVAEPPFVKPTNHLRKAAEVVHSDRTKLLITTCMWYRPSHSETFRYRVRHYSGLTLLMPSNFGYFWGELVVLGRLLFESITSSVRTGTASGTRTHPVRQCHPADEVNWLSSIVCAMPAGIGFKST